MSNQTQDYSPAWPGPSLFVPMAADCLLVGEPDRSVTTTPTGKSSSWAQTGTNYQNLLLRMVPDTAPPFTTKIIPDEIPGAGAHIIWTLPYALRHGQQVQTGSNAGGVDFPPAPNRWAVLRLQYNPGSPAAAPVLTAGIIQSDQLNALTSPLPISQYPDPSNPSNGAVRIGGYVPLSDWNGPAGPATPFVKVVGPGDVSWAVAYDNIRNVFSFYDRLPDQNATLTYCIVGWYSRPAHDPLFQMPGDDPAAWQTKVETDFNWNVGSTSQDVTAAQAAWAVWQKAHGLDGSTPQGLPQQLLQAIQRWQRWQAEHGESGPAATLPQQLICHATIAQVPWRGPRNAYGTGAPGQGMQFPGVSIGNTATEAIAAWFADYLVRKQGGDPGTINKIERSIEAFQKNVLLELEDDPVSAEFMLHRARFGSADGGKEWIVVRPEAEDGQAGQFGGQQTVPLNADQTLALTNLNQLQTAADQKRALLYSQRLELFLVHFKLMSLPKRTTPKPILDQVTKARDTILAAAQATANELKQQDDAVNAASKTFAQQLGADFVLRLVDRPAFYAPNDPVLMVAAVQQDTKFAPPGTYDDDETLFTRFTGQSVTGIDVEVGGVSVTLDASDLLKELTLPPGTGIPKELPDLWLEAVWLDPSSTPFLARLASAKAPRIDPATATQVIYAQQTMLYNNKAALGVDEKALGAAARLHGVPPASVALNLRLRQPWTPIFMDWKVSWCPSWSGPSDTLSGKGWSLGDNDYEWSGQNVQVPAPKLIFAGRTVLNPKIAQDIAARLALFNDDPDYSSLDVDTRNRLNDLAREIGNFDIMTQSLGGFTERLITQMVASNKAPEDAAVAAALGSDPITFRPIFDDPKKPSTLPFFPVRAGHLQVLDLWVVDSWGQILRGKDPTLGPDSPLDNLLRAESVTTEGTQNKKFVQLPPRISQPARVELLMLQADDDAVRSNSSDLTSPICGWVMPNHLDDSLMVFSASGDGLGSIIKVQTDRTQANPQGSGIRWDAVPGSDAPLGAPPELPNEHLQSFIDGLLRRGRFDGGTAFDGLLSAVDSSLWAMAAGTVSEGNLSVLLGRPLAVVRAELSLNLFGQSVYNQSLLETGNYYVGEGGAYNPKPTPFQSVAFYARVGDLSLRTNGVLGYFLDDDYDHFQSVQGSGMLTAPLRAAFRQPGGRAAELLGTLSSPAAMRAATTGDAGDGYVQFGSLVALKPNGSKSMLTLLLDPRGVIPVVTGSLPVETVALAPGPATAALRRMKAHFRVGPVLTDPSTIQMPLPAEIRGRWAWMARTDVTNWSGEQPVQTQSPILRLESTPLRLGEGWLVLSSAETGE